MYPFLSDSQHLSLCEQLLCALHIPKPFLNFGVCEFKFGETSPNVSKLLSWQTKLRDTSIFQTSLLHWRPGKRSRTDGSIFFLNLCNVYSQSPHISGLWYRSEPKIVIVSKFFGSFWNDMQRSNGPFSRGPTSKRKPTNFTFSRV